MATQSFKDLLVWQKAADFTEEIYKNFGGLKDCGFKDQIQRASISIMNNTAEGYAKRSDKAFRNYLSIAKGSAAEVESMIIIARRLGYIDEKTETNLIEKINEIGRLISGFIKKLSAEDY